MRVAVTGSAGFVGSHVVAELERSGIEVVRCERRAPPAPPAVELADLVALSERFSGVDAVVHAAGSASATADERILGWLEVAGTENVARAARRAGVGRFVVISSTDANLGDSPRTNAPEGFNAVPIGCAFGRIAKAKEEATIALGTKRFEPVVLRAGFLYGARERTRAPRFAAEARTHGGIRIVGRPLSFLPTTNVVNLAHAVRLALVAPRAAHGVYHVLDRELSSQIAFFDRYSEALGVGAPIRGSSLFIERFRARFGRGLDEGEVLRRGLTSTLDTRRARDELGYDAPASLEDGMSALADWVRSVGGAASLEALVRPDPDESAIAALVRAAG